ncbi:hypothetical protein ACEQ8H_008216 [Pleosporales sp. CAS-2024a]
MHVRQKVLRSPTKNLDVDAGHRKRHVEPARDMEAQLSGPEVSLSLIPAPLGRKTSDQFSIDRSLLSCMQDPEGSSEQLELVLPERRKSTIDAKLWDDHPYADSDRSVLPAVTQFDMVRDIDSARQQIQASLKQHLDERYEDHAYLVKSIMWRQRTCYEDKSRSSANSARFQSLPSNQSEISKLTSPFESMRNMQVRHEKNNRNANIHVISQEVFVNTTSKDIATRSSWNIQATTYASDDVQIPPFIEYVSSRTNVLADNVSKRLTMPWLSDEQPEPKQEALVRDLPTVYEIKHSHNAQLDLRIEQCRFYYDSVSLFLAQMGVTWDSLLFWLLSSDIELKRINRKSDWYSDFELAILDRADYNKESFRRDNEKKSITLFDRRDETWKKLLPLLERPSSVQLRATALACRALLTNCNFSPWYMARESTTMQNYVTAKTRVAESDPISTFRGIVCRVCHQHNCFFHGEIREEPEDDMSSDNSSDELSPSGEPVHFVSDDDDVEKVVNYKFPSNPNFMRKEKWSDIEVTRGKPVPSGPFNPTWWKKNTNTANWEKRKPFVPYLCGLCGATELLDPVNRYSETLSLDTCANVGLQKGVSKKTLLGKSQVHGFGLYAGEDIQKNEVIGEYTGEIISNGESNRREVIYSYEKNMYTFRVNKHQDVDATHMANKLRFINNAKSPWSNCYSKVLFCNTVFRIALCADRDIKAGTELFFDYHYPEEMTKSFKQPEGKLFAVKQITSKIKKPKTWQTDASHDPHKDSGPSRAVLQGLIKARSAKAAKRAAELAKQEQQAAEVPNPNRAVSQARKSARHANRSSPKPTVEDDGSRRQRESSDGGGRRASGSIIGTRLIGQSRAYVVQDPDEDEDKDSTIQETQAGAEASEDQSSDVEENGEAERLFNSAVQRRVQWSRTRIVKSASLVPVQTTKQRTELTRVDTAKKRKRPVIVNSEDE